MSWGSPRVIRSRDWFFSVTIPRIISESTGKSQMEVAVRVAKEAYSAQNDHIDALEKRDEAFSEVLHLIQKECVGCGVLDKAKKIMGEK